MMILDGKFFEEIRPWIKEYEEWGETLSDLEEAIQILLVLLSKEYPPKVDVYKFKKSIDKIKMDVRKFADHKTSIFTREMRNFVYETLMKLSLISNWKSSISI